MNATASLNVRRAVSPLELFYDLVFIFAVSQFTHHLHEQLSWRGAVETAVLLVAIFSVWAVTSFGATLLDIARPRTKYLLLTAMGLGVFMNAGIAHAFTDNVWTFLVPFLLIMLGFSVVTALIAPTKVLRLHYQRGLMWGVASTPLWLIGALISPEQRLWWWAAAATIDLLGVWLAHPLPGRTLRTENLEFDGEHMLERLRLFLILILGETVLTIGRTASDSPTDLPTVLATLGVFIAIVCLWASYFGGGEDLVSGHLGATADPIRAVRLGINVTYGGLAGLVSMAVGSEQVIGHPLDERSGTVSLLLFGGITIYFASQAWYFRAVVRAAWVERVIGCVAIAGVGIVARWLAPILSLAILDTVLIVLVMILARTDKRLAGT